jgi:DNA-directed RNA polymerase subunit M/transcription elongation factor TFIIS
MANKQWNVRCPHCGAVSTETPDGLKARHTLAVVKAIGGGAVRVREATENFDIECAQCGKSSPFEPLSVYRRRKLESVSKRLSAIADLELDPAHPWTTRAMDEGDKKVLDLTCRTAGIFYESLQRDFPLELVRENCAKVMAAVEREVAAMGPGPKGAEPMRLLREAAAIAQADVGERADLVDVTVDDLEKGRQEMMAKLGKARQGQPGGATPVAPAAKSKCFIATAACGTPDDPRVEILRRFRDGTLARHKAGRSLTLCYERFSPPVAEWIGARPLARAVVRLCVVRPAAFCAKRIGSLL